MAVFLNEADIAKILTMSLALDAVESVMTEVASGEAINVPRERLHGPATSLHLLQGSVGSRHAIGYKSYSVSQGTARFLVHIYDARNGELLGILSGQQLGAMRTGAASGVATKWLANPDARTLGVFGRGKQAAAQIEAVCAVRPITDVKVFARNQEALAVFCGDLSRKLDGPRIRPAASAREAVQESQVVTTITTAEAPVFRGEWLEPGTHVNAAGSNMLHRREIDETTLQRCAVLAVDSIDVAKKESGDILPLIEKGKLAWGQIAELGELMTRRKTGRRQYDDITCFESFGMAVQDVALGARLIEEARRLGIGVELPSGL